MYFTFCFFSSGIVAAGNIPCFNIPAACSSTSQNTEIIHWRLNPFFRTLSLGLTATLVAAHPAYHIENNVLF
ncbi:hypothetical protein B0T17DRAFT_62953 [Bombardia bombarda]|uniref:Uncharacterized protein n=1 Tax=Bombardia bombarda TaxID=252184 RepID=A0AA39XKY3_9PEZI|nr:hypothetical protein B0T17DRAFT_62953 [Bombardia bombarda]